MDVIASAPAKAILLGEHAVNRGATALAVSIGLRVTCRVCVEGHGLWLEGAGNTRQTNRDEITRIGRWLEAAREVENYVAIQQFARDEFFGPALYLLAGFGDGLPQNARITFQSAIPMAAGLGSGGAAGVALAAAMAATLGRAVSPREIAALAHRGDVVAHGGVASGLDSQTSLYGGAIQYTSAVQGEPIVCASGLQLVIGNTNVYAATSVVNGRVRAWLAEQPARMHYFREIALLSRHAEVALREGDWPELGRLMNLNQLVLERIGVSCPELERLNEAALAAGALGAKLSGSGGGGIMIALVTPETHMAVAEAIAAAGGHVIVAEVGVPGVETHQQ